MTAEQKVLLSVVMQLMNGEVACYSSTQGR